MKVLIVLAGVLLGTQTVSCSDWVKEQWDTFKLKYGKQYSSVTDENFRMKIFEDNMHMIETHNQRFERGLVSYNLAMNQFGDLLHHEVVQSYTDFNKSLDSEPQEEGTTFIEPEYVQLPDFVDWRKKGAVTPVIDMFFCYGGSYAFSTIGSLEGQHFRKTGRLRKLSEQNLIDCSKKYGNYGCSGGLTTFSFKYIKANGGIDLSEYYPYDGGCYRCRYMPKYAGATVTGYVKIKSKSEKQLQVAVATVGPVSVVVDVMDSFRFYKSGVYDEPECNSSRWTQSVLVVGYGTTDDGKDYWIVKNSWWVVWGEKGYIRMSRNKNNQCDIATNANYPLV